MNTSLYSRSVHFVVGQQQVYRFNLLCSLVTCRGEKCKNDELVVDFIGRQLAAIVLAVESD